MPWDRSRNLATERDSVDEQAARGGGDASGRVGRSAVEHKGDCRRRILRARQLTGRATKDRGSRKGDLQFETYARGSRPRVSDTHQTGPADGRIRKAVDEGSGISGPNRRSGSEV